MPGVIHDERSQTCRRVSQEDGGALGRCRLEDSEAWGTSPLYGDSCIALDPFGNHASIEALERANQETVSPATQASPDSGNQAAETIRGASRINSFYTAASGGQHPLGREGTSLLSRATSALDIVDAGRSMLDDGINAENSEQMARAGLRTGSDIASAYGFSGGSHMIKTVNGTIDAYEGFESMAEDGITQENMDQATLGTLGVSGAGLAAVTGNPALMAVDTFVRAGLESRNYGNHLLRTYAGVDSSDANRECQAGIDPSGGIVGQIAGGVCGLAVDLGATVLGTGVAQGGTGAMLEQTEQAIATAIEGNPEMAQALAQEGAGMRANAMEAAAANFGNPVGMLWSLFAD